MAAKLIGAQVIPVGAVIQKLRESVPEFNYKSGEISLNRDGLHLSFDYGRYAAAATWYYTFTGQKIKIKEFENFNISLINKIINTVEQNVCESSNI